MLGASYQIDKPELNAGSVGVPFGQQGILVAAATAGTLKAKQKRKTWRRGMEREQTPKPPKGAS